MTKRDEERIDHGPESAVEVNEPADVTTEIIEDKELSNQSQDPFDEDQDQFDEGREFTEEELAQMFKEAEEEEETYVPFFASPLFRKIVLSVIGIVMGLQVVAWWPQIFSLDAIRFLRISAQLSQSEEIQTYKQSVVVVRTEDAKGTGFIISEDGWIVTNRHVIDGAEQPSVSLPNGDRLPARVAAVSDQVDLALLQIEAEGLPALQLAEHYHGESALPVYIIGNPLFFDRIVNQGETLGLIDYQPPMLVLQAPVYKGNSGSPVIDEAGRVIGVVYATTTLRLDGKDTKVGLAVPVQWLHELSSQHHIVIE